ENKNPRKLTPRECARLQGFPEQFIIPVSDTQAYKQFGNSVAVPVIRAVAEKVVEAVKGLPIHSGEFNPEILDLQSVDNISEVKEKKNEG
ncbi:MAG: DNA cytosine methyltransferase, partial [Anaerostipes sp.]|nr:DNA cytosine methyltransferase [Anaerostipes sp.]